MQKNPLVPIVLATAISLAACAPAASPTFAPTLPPASVRAQIIILSNSKPHVTVVDAETNQIVKTAEIANFTSWTWNDDNNFSDGKNLWLGMRNPDTNDVEVVLFDLDTLQIVKRLPLGQDKVTLYIGKPTRGGKLYVSKHASGQLAVIGIQQFTLLKTVDLPVNGGVACDIDVVVGADGKERGYVPTDNGNTILSIDTETEQVLQTLSIPEGTRPFMLTAAPDGKRIWVQERNTNGEVIVDAVNLKVIQRVQTGKNAIVNTFSPDGKLSFTANNQDTVVTANDSETFKEVWRAQVGTNPEKVGVHPSGKWVYAIIGKEAALVVLDVATGKLNARVSLGTNPTGIYVRAIK